jgi:FMN-dependent NADH-azoreductase
MKKILRIDVSARTTRSLTRHIADNFMAAFLEACPTAEIIVRDIGAVPPPVITETWIAAAFKPAEERTNLEREALQHSDELIAELRAADLIVLSTPLYNYGMPAALKAWVDQVIRVGETFSFDLARGDFPIEPILSGKKLIVLTSSGEFGFNPGGIRHSSDHLIPHLQTISKYLGVDTVDFIRIEYQEFGDDRHQESKIKAYKLASAKGHVLGKALHAG